MNSTRLSRAIHAVIAPVSLSITLVALPALAAEAPTPGKAAPQSVVVQMPDPAKQLPLDELRKFTEVFDRIKKAYVEEVDDTTLLNNAIRGMLSGLDPHSAYLEPQAFEDLEESTTGEFGGLGIEVGMEDGFVKVVTPIDDTPASKAGIETGDYIIEIDGKPVKGLGLEEAVNMMRGKPGTEIRLMMLREGKNSNAPYEVKLTRAVIKVNSVKTRLLEPGYGYLRITQFQAKSGDDFITNLKKLVKENKDEKLKGLVLDLRNNLGGVLQSAVEIADSLLEDGLIVYTEGRIRSSQLRFTATPGDLTGGTPIVVLINGGSASASEILAGALQDHHRAFILGTQSFGKGSVQTVMPLNEEYGLKLTTARYYTPNGRSIQALGIVPDIEVKQAKLEEVKNPQMMKEADLAGHLSNDVTPEESVDEAANKVSSPLDNDYQLRSAVNMLKGLSIYDKGQAAAP